MLRIKELRKAKGMTSKELAAKVGVAESTMSLYENCKRKPDFDTLGRIAGILDTDLDFLLGRSSQLRPASGKRIPVYGSVAAGIPIDAITDIEDYEEISADMAKSGEFVALRIKGSSMEPLLLQGDVVIVRVQNTIESGEIAVVLVGGDEATCKRVQRSSEGIILSSINPAFEPMFFSNDMIESMPVLIFGKVVEMRRTL